MTNKTLILSYLTCRSTDHLKKDCPERGGASGGEPRETETQKDIAAPAPQAEGGGKKRPLPTGGKEAPAKSTKVGAGPFSPEGSETGGRTAEIGVQKDTTFFSENSSPETSSGGSASSSRMESPDATTAAPLEAPTGTQREGTLKDCVWCGGSHPYDPQHCPKMICYMCDEKHLVEECPVAERGGMSRVAKVTSPVWKEPHRVIRYYLMPGEKDQTVKDVTERIRKYHT